MIELFACSSPNVVKVYIMLEETGLPYRTTYVNVFIGEQHEPDFFKINPNRKVPVIIDPHGPAGGAHTIIESGAILFYLAEKTGQFLGRDGTERSLAMQWLMFQMASVGPMFGQLVHFLRYAPVGHDYSRARYMTEMRRILDVLETRLSEVEFFAGTTYTIADMAVFPWIRAARRTFPAVQGESDAEGFATYPGLGRWYAAIKARPAVIQAVAKVTAEAQVPDQTSQREMSPEQLDRFVGRGKFSRI